MNSIIDSRLSVIEDLADSRRRALVLMMPFVILACIITDFATRDSLNYHMYNTPLLLGLSFIHTVNWALMYIRWRREVPYILFACFSMAFVLIKLTLLLIYVSPEFLPYGIAETIVWIYPTIIFLLLNSLHSYYWKMSIFLMLAVSLVSVTYSLVWLDSSSIKIAVSSLLQLNLTGWIIILASKGYIIQKQIYAQQMERLNYLETVVYTDLLTGLNNRRYLEKYLEDYISANSKGNLSLVLINLDNFKLINDSLGHEQGDEILKQVAKLLLESSKPQMLVTRLNGDEFVLIVPSDRGEQAEYFSRIISDRLHSEGLKLTPEFNHIHLTLSIGISVYPNDAQQPKELLRHADSAMLTVKRSGKQGFKRYNHTDDAHLEDQQRLVHDLNGAIERNELSVMFQPVYDLKAGNLKKVEVLMHWQHPTLGSILPEVFIPLAEQFGLIALLGQWALKQSCHYAKQWDGIQVCVNISMLHVSQHSFVSELAHVLAEYQVKPTQLALELTESVIIQENPYTDRVLHQISDMGVELIVDGFGTGYSNLNRLRTLPVGALKLDKSFTVDAVGTATEHLYAQQMITSTVSLSQIANLRVMAEGIETQQQLERMQELGCHYGQGDLLAKSCTAQQFEALLREPVTFHLPRLTTP